MSPLSLGIARAAGSIAGIMATLMWPMVVKSCNDDSVSRAWCGSVTPRSRSALDASHYGPSGAALLLSLSSSPSIHRSSLDAR